MYVQDIKIRINDIIYKKIKARNIYFKKYATKCKQNDKVRNR